MNLYAYVGNDPVNATDPWGLQEEDEIVVTGRRPRHPPVGRPPPFRPRFLDDWLAKNDGMSMLMQWEAEAAARIAAMETRTMQVRDERPLHREDRPLSDCEQSVLSPHFAREVLDWARIHEGDRPGLAMGNDSITLGRHIYIERGFSRTVLGMGLLAHEVTHPNENYYGSMTAGGWAWEAMTRGHNNRHEVFARDMQRQVEGPTPSAGFFRVSLMKSKSLGVALLLLTTSACLSSDPAVPNCATIRERYLSVSLTEEQFARYDDETKYQMFICGSQSQHPPMLLATFLAPEGERMAHFLAQKLAQSRYDLTTRDILEVYHEMMQQGSYDVRNDAEVMRLLQTKVTEMHAGATKDHAGSLLQQIRRGPELGGPLVANPDS